jgi:hypothetical protein
MGVEVLHREPMGLTHHFVCKFMHDAKCEPQ